MKKILACVLAIFAVVSFTQVTFAGSLPGNYQSKNISIQEAVKRKITNGIGPSTMVDVINYSDFTIDVTNLSFPTFNRLTRQTAARIVSDTWLDPVYLRLADSISGRPFFEQLVSRTALISVYVSNGQYVVYNTPT